MDSGLSSAYSSAYSSAQSSAYSSLANTPREVSQAEARDAARDHRLAPSGRDHLSAVKHGARLPSGRRGLSRKMLAAIRAFYDAQGALDKLMGDVCKEEGFDASVCSLTRCMGLSLVESLDHVADGRAGAAFAALVEAYDVFAPSDVKYDISQAEFQGDALTTAAWMWDDAAAAARRHKARHTLDE